MTRLPAFMITLMLSTGVVAQTTEPGALGYLGAFGFFGAFLFLVFLVILGILLPLFVWRTKVWTQRGYMELVKLNEQVEGLRRSSDASSQYLNKLTRDLGA